SVGDAPPGGLGIERGQAGAGPVAAGAHRRAPRWRGQVAQPEVAREQRIAHDVLRRVAGAGAVARLALDAGQIRAAGRRLAGRVAGAAPAGGGLGRAQPLERARVAGAAPARGDLLVAGGARVHPGEAGGSRRRRRRRQRGGHEEDEVAQHGARVWYTPGVRVIGLTGGIASGKSTVAAILRELGAPVVDADQIARRVVEPGTPALAEIA